MSIEVRVLATPGLVDISPPGSGDEVVPSTFLRVPGVLRVTVEPTGEEAELTPIGLRLEAVLFDEMTGHSVLDPWFAGVPRPPAADGSSGVNWSYFPGPHVGDWRYKVVEMTLGGGGGITTATLVAIRLPALLRRALRGIVLLIKDGGYSIDASDLDELAVVAYVSAQLAKENPTTAVATELGIKPNAAAQRVYRLRKAGRLPATRKGKR